MTLQEIHLLLVKCWVDYARKLQNSQTYTKLVPMFYPEFHENALLFIGLNPSVGEYVKSVLKGSKFEDSVSENYRDFFLFDKDNILNQIAYFQEIQEIHHKNYKKYFGLIKCLAENRLKTSWNQLDLFFIRETISITLLNDLKNGTHLEEFFKCQVEIFGHFLSLANPKMIIILNRSVSEFMLSDEKISKWKSPYFKSLQLVELFKENYTYGIYQTTFKDRIYICRFV